MQIITNLIESIQIIAIAVILILIVFALLGWYVLKKRKKQVIEKKIDYTQFQRKDTLEYIKFEDVGEYMLVAENKKRFIGAIKCKGLDYTDLEIDAKLQTIRGYITFFNVVDNEPIQYRQSSRDVNLDGLIESYEECLVNLNEQRFLLNADYEEMRAASENEAVAPGDYDIYFENLKRMQREMVSLGYQAEQLGAQVQYMRSISGENAESRREEVYVFEWNYSEVDFSSNTLSEQEIHQKAEKQLKAKADAYISALHNAGVKAYRMNTLELLEEIRRYTHPISAAKSTVDDIVKMAYDSICVTSHSLRKMEEKVNEQVIKDIIQDVI